MKHGLILLSILSLGIFFRFYTLSSLPNGLHWDEQDTGYQALSLFTTGRDYFGNPIPAFPHSLADFRTPVYIYSAVPIVSSLGLNAFSVRLTSAIWGSLGLIALYLLTVELTKSKTVAALSSLFLAFSHWHLLYSRKSVETISLNTTFLVALTCFFSGLKNPRWLPVSALLFGLATAAYSPGKLFVPLFLGTLLIIYFRRLWSIKKAVLIVSGLLYLIIALPIYLDGLFGASGTRFRDVSVFTNPVIAKSVDNQRLTSLLSSGVPISVGLSPRVVDRLWFNKPIEWGSAIVQNYLTTFSTEFLFTKGDPEPRHSPSKNSIGQLHLVEILPLLLGLLVLITPSFLPKSVRLVLLAWLLLAPIPSALTREGGNHAARLLILLPALLITVSLGVYAFFKQVRFALPVYLLIFFISAFYYFGYFFNTYRFESAKPYQWGFDKAIGVAVSESSNYDKIYVDLGNDSGLMAYLFYTQFPPQKFQNLQPLSDTEVLPGVRAHSFGNIHLLQPGSRHWTNIFDTSHYRGNNLIISVTTQPLVETIPAKQVINYPDGTPAYDVISRQR